MNYDGKGHAFGDCLHSSAPSAYVSSNISVLPTPRRASTGTGKDHAYYRVYVSTPTKGASKKEIYRTSWRSWSRRAIHSALLGSWHSASSTSAKFVRSSARPTSSSSSSSPSSSSSSSSASFFFWEVLAFFAFRPVDSSTYSSPSDSSSSSSSSSWSGSPPSSSPSPSSSSSPSGERHVSPASGEGSGGSGARDASSAPPPPPQSRPPSRSPRSRWSSTRWRRPCSLRSRPSARRCSSPPACPPRDALSRRAPTLLRIPSLASLRLTVRELTES
mmetsp:Transcript_40494/g.127064  ORF Transcript_40494/g.127064 Transcript_40494/m.127064 type:complete len:274 (-) Transcript_40494:107-928(-)